MLYLECQLKNGCNIKIKTIKHCENLLKASNEQYVKNAIVINSNFSQYKIIKIKNDVVITTYRQISLKNTLIIGTVGN